MIPIAGLALVLFLQAPAATPPATVAAADDGATERAPATEPWKGTFEEGFEALMAHTKKSEFDEALSIADGLLAPSSFLRWKLEFQAKGGWRASLSHLVDPALDAAGWNGLEAPVRAEIWFAKGVIHETAKKRDLAATAFEQALELAGAGELRLDAIYDLGCLALADGEEQRAKIPEISGQQPPAPPAAAPGAAAPEKQPDPLELARAAYMKARDRFVERLKSGTPDDDTRANVELVMKRLKELDQLQKKREEEKQDQKDKDKKDKPKDPNDKQDQDPSKDKKDDEKKDKQDPPKDPKDQDQKPGEDKKDENKEDPKKPDEPKPDESKDQKKDDAKQPPEKADPREQQMSKEEMTQILDRLRQLEEQGKKLQQQLRDARRVKVKKDW